MFEKDWKSSIQQNFKDRQQEPTNYSSMGKRICKLYRLRGFESENKNRFNRIVFYTVKL